MTKSTENPNLVVYAGRFQFYHSGHHALVLDALSRADHLLLVIGSSYSERTAHNPFTHNERQRMISACLTEEQESRVFFAHIKDVDPATENADKVWADSIVNAAVTISKQNGIGQRVSLLGHTKDESSYYLSLFPQWGRIEAPNFEGLSATPLRTRYFKENPIYSAEDMVRSNQIPAGVGEFLKRFGLNHTYFDLRKLFQ